MLTTATLPVLMALSWPPPHTPPATPTPAPAADSGETISCPLTGEEIPTCCCPLKK